MMKSETMGSRVFPRMVFLAVIAMPLIAGAAQGSKPGATAPQSVKADSVTWLLAGREGECAPLSLLAKRGPAYAEIKGPSDLVEKLHANGYEAELKEFNAGSRPAVEVRAPSAGIHVMFIKKELCDKVPERRP